MAPQTDQTNTLIGLADVCELMAATWAFPKDGSLAAALASGSYTNDLRGCLTDAGFDENEVEEACGELAAFAGRDVQSLAEALKRGHSLLFCAPGATVPVWPYEAAFRFVAQGRQGAPSLFRSPIELDVERAMREVGVLPEHARTEPPDSIWGEFSFMAYLLAQAASCLQNGSEDDGDAWFGRAATFAREHMSTWIPAFFERTVVEAASREHAQEFVALASVGAICWRALACGLGCQDR